MYYNFEIFHMREKNIPVDSVEIKEPTHAFAWEPVGDKFAVIHGKSPFRTVRNKVSNPKKCLINDWQS